MDYESLRFRSQVYRLAGVRRYTVRLSPTGSKLPGIGTSSATLTDEKNSANFVLPTTYFRVVFSIPNDLNAFALENPGAFYKLLFQASSASALAIDSFRRRRRYGVRFRGRFIDGLNHRLLALDGERVTSRRRDYAHGKKLCVMTLDTIEFLRRFFLHILAKGFVRIWDFGFLANCFRTVRVALCRALLSQAVYD